MNWILSRFKEPSSWRGLVIVAGIFGCHISPELQDQIIALGTCAIGLIEVVRKEKANGSAGVTADTGSADDK